MNQAGTRLKQWQVTGAAWMLEQEKSTVGGDILAQTGCQQMLEQPNRACPQSEAAVLDCGYTTLLYTLGNTEHLFSLAPDIQGRWQQQPGQAWTFPSELAGSPTK
ncbi:LOW QUALITY PROTEIN: hypothetical protein IFM47457_07352 [Aspergillus lentulus]|nr:LOW QUALITY PROTEIN: hypothetical protein IFM47457_07352 [Aspergillus lentulus]